MELRPDVCIILNEQEHPKEVAAERLCARLETERISSIRERPHPGLLTSIRRQSPRVTVLDYLLGDLGTAIELLPEMARLPRRSLPIIWTDEPSVSVAIAAMKLGVYDYIEMNQPHSLDRVIAHIQTALSRSTDIAVRRSVPPPTLSSAAYREVLRQISLLAHSAPPYLVLYGECGVGRDHLARQFHHTRRFAGRFMAVDAYLHPEPLEYLTERSLETGKTVFIDHIDGDPHIFLDALSNRRHPPPISLAVGTTIHEVALLWSRTLDAPLVDIPPLRERPEDLIPLITYFESVLGSGGRDGIISRAPGLPPMLLEHRWEGNLRELRAVVEHLLLAPRQSKWTEEELDALVGKASARWSRFRRPIRRTPTLWQARKALDLFEGDVRLAAIALDASLADLRNILAESRS